MNVNRNTVSTGKKRGKKKTHPDPLVPEDITRGFMGSRMSLYIKPFSNVRINLVLSTLLLIVYCAIIDKIRIMTQWPWSNS